MKSLHNSLEKMLNRLAEQSGTVELLRLTRAWQKAVGPLIAARAFVYRYDRGTVFVGTTDSVWVQELLLQKQKLLQKLRKTGVPIEEILFFPKVRPIDAHRSFHPGR